ncbi:hypothetical protein ADZ37_20770 [Pannonibacter phragmitetus]|nr:hypothetical protein [Pannonibacter phragmitetus]KND16850.1 hypothetical protein ADZ37_20770 [Pannonibacter phragmitetus]
MIFMEKRRKYVKLNWDCITIDPSEDGHVRGDAESDLMPPMREIFKRLAKNAPSDPFFLGKSFVGSIDRLSPETAYEMADTFFEMLYPPTIKRY